MIPSLLGEELVEHDIWHSSNYTYLDYVEDIPEPVLSALTDEDISWMRSLFDSDPFTQVREEYIKLSQKLKDTHEVDDRRRILRFMDSLTGKLQ